MDYSYIVQEQLIKLSYEGHIETKRMIENARKQGISGRIEIHHVFTQENENYIYALKFVNQFNKITGEVFPFIHYQRERSA